MRDAKHIGSQLADLWSQAQSWFEDISSTVSSLQALIIQHFGQTGLYATYIVLAVMVLVVVSRLAKITLSTVKLLVIPAIALAFLGSLFTAFSFVGLLPITVVLCSLILLFKG